MRFIGLEDNDLSPVIVALIPNPLKNPASNLAPVPEFPKSNDSEGSWNGTWRFTVFTVFDDLLSIKLAFNWLSAFAVQIGSLDERMLLMKISWFKYEPIINTLCEID